MFILRKLVFDGKNAVESNQILGDNYSVVTGHNPDWDTLMKEWETFKDSIYAFVIYNDGSKVIPLYKKQGNYIMTSDGKTFANQTRHVDFR